MTSIIYQWSIDEWHELVDSGVLAGKPVELLEGNIVDLIIHLERVTICCNSRL